MGLQSTSHHSTRIREMLGNPATMATVAHAICLNAFGTEFHDWETEALELELRDEFGIEPNPAVVNRLHALIAALASDSFTEDWIAYAAICSALSNEDGEPEINGPLPTAYLAWGTTEVLLNESHPVKWGPEVARYAGVILSEDGFIKAPEPLGFAQVKDDEYYGEGTSSKTQREGVETSHKQVVEEFIHEQAKTLFHQLSFLPWMTPEKLNELAGHIKFG